MIYRKRMEILRATRQEITRYGISAFRVEEIAWLMGMSKRTIYRIFPTKANLLSLFTNKNRNEEETKYKSFVLVSTGLIIGCMSLLTWWICPKFTVLKS